MHLTAPSLNPSTALTEPATAPLNLYTFKSCHSILIFFFLFPFPYLEAAQIILDCDHGGMSDIYSDFSLSWGVPQACQRQSLKLSLSTESLSIFACWEIRGRGWSLNSADRHALRDTHRFVLRIDRGCVNAHAGLSWGSGCWKLSLEGNTADCWVTDTYTQPFN